MRAPRSKLRRRLLALTISLFASLVAVEVVFRVVFGAPLSERLPVVRVQANPHRGWEMVPGEEHFTYHHRVRVNAYGLRGAEVRAKAPGEVRVLTLGDSLVYGQGVADDETVPWYLERALELRDPLGREWTVINGGHRAYDTHQELGLLEELGPELEPDIVVIFFFWNDFKERDIAATYSKLSASGPIAFDVGAKMEGWTELKWRAIQVLRRSAAVMTLYDTVGKRSSPFPWEQVRRNGVKRLGRYLDSFLALSRELDSELVFVVVPDANALSRPHPSTAIADAAAELAAAKGLPVVRFDEPLQALQLELGGAPVIPYDGHYLPAANRAMASMLADALLAPLGPDVEDE